ncbi:MAG: hypothetical protein ACOVMP_08930 [Chthoniobacterales bacterium]
MKKTLITVVLAMLACTSHALEVQTKDGRTIKVAAVKKWFPSAVQVVDENGKVYLLRSVDISAEHAEALRSITEALPVNEAKPPSDATSADRPPWIKIEINHKGHKSETVRHYESSWGSYITESKQSEEKEVVIVLMRPHKIEARIVIVVGDRVEVLDEVLLRAEELRYRVGSGERSRTVTALKALGAFYVDREGSKPNYFVQIQQNGKVVAEEGALADHEPGKLLVIDEE